MLITRSHLPTEFDRNFSIFDHMFRDLDRALFSRTATDSARVESGRVGSGLDIEEVDDGWMVRVLVPGLGPKDVEVTVESDILTISAERPTPTPEGARLIRRERPAFTLQRSLSIGRDVNVDEISATVQRGVLEVHLPRLPERQPRSITVNAE